MIRGGKRGLSERFRDALLKDLRKSREKLEEKHFLLIRNLSRVGKIRTAKSVSNTSFSSKDTAETVVPSPFVQVQIKESTDASIGTDFDYSGYALQRPSVPVIEIAKVLPPKPSTSLPHKRTPRPPPPHNSHSSPSRSLAPASNDPSVLLSAEKLQSLCVGRTERVVRILRTRQEYQGKSATTYQRGWKGFRRRKFVSLSEVNLIDSEEKETLALVGRVIQKREGN